MHTGTHDAETLARVHDTGKYRGVFSKLLFLIFF
jgi:hypothetical protein